MLIHGKMDSSSVNGPGNRAVLWFQGCSLGCKGCWNPETHAFHQRNQVSIGEIQDWIKGLKDVEGITLSGGEPMQQSQYLYVLIAWIREHRPDLTIGMYTGYNKKELENGKFKWKPSQDVEWILGSDTLWNAIKANLDFAVVGRYVESMACHDEPLRGSKNQEVLFFTDRYSESSLSPQIAEITVSGEDSLIQITGYPTVEFLDGMTRKPQLVTSRGPATKIKEEDDGGDLVTA